VFILAVVVCLEYALGADFGIDEFLGRDYVKVRTSHPGRMSPVSAFCFIGSSLALLVASSSRPVRFASTIVGVLASMLIAVGTVSILGYLLVHILRPLFILEPSVTFPTAGIAALAGLATAATLASALTAAVLLRGLRPTELLRET
jgi:hypothetical protein